MAGWDKYKIFVTGGAGFIGSHLVDALMDMGCYVRVVDNLSNGKLANLNQHKRNRRFDFVKGSVLNSSLMAKTMKGFDIVFHLACLGVRHSIKHPFDNHRVNAEGALIVLENTYQQKIKKFVYCSSSEVYGDAKVIPMPESHPTHPHTVYGASKLAGEAYARAYDRAYGLNTTIVRLFNTFGPRSHYEGDAGEIIPKAIVRALSNKPILIFGDGQQTRDFTFVHDSAQALIEAAKNPMATGKTFNAGSNFEISMKQVANLILKLIPGSRSKIEFLEKRPGDVRRLYADPTKFCRLTGWKPQSSFKEGLIKTVEWFQSTAKNISELAALETGRNW